MISPNRIAVPAGRGAVLPAVLFGLMALAVTAPLLTGPYILGHDGGFHLYNLCEYGDSLARGIVVAHITPNFYAGLGGINFKYYPPYVYAPASLLWLAGVPAYRALVLAVLLSFWVSGLGLYAWARRFLSRRAALLSGGVYVLASYHLQDLYFRFAYAELWGLALAPWVFWSATDAARRSGGWPLIRTAVLVAATGLAHALTAVMVTPFLAAWWFLVAGFRLRAIASLTAVLLLAAGLGAFYAWPAYRDRGDVLMSRQFPDGSAYRAAALRGADLVRSPGHGPAWKPSIDWPLLLLGALGAGWMLGRRKPPARRVPPRIPGGLLCFGGLALLLALPLGASLVGIVPPLRYLQFPWRFLLIVTLSLSWCAGGALPGRGARGATGRLALAAGLVVLSVALTLLGHGLVRGRTTDLAGHLGDRETYRRTIRSAYWGNDVELKYLPIRVADAVGKRPVAPGREPERMLRNEPERIAFTVREAEAEWVVRLPRIYVPGWIAETGPGEIRVGPDDATGLMRVEGRRAAMPVRLRYVGSRAYRIGLWITWVSLLAVALWAAGCAVLRLRSRHG
jgi:hypothetical protein